MSISSVAHHIYTPPPPVNQSIGAASLFPAASSPATQAGASGAPAQPSGGISFASIASDLQSILIGSQGSNGGQPATAAGQSANSQTASSDASDPAQSQSTTDGNAAAIQHHHHRSPEAGSPDSQYAGSSASEIGQALQAYAASAAMFASGGLMA